MHTIRVLYLSNPTQIFLFNLKIYIFFIYTPIYGKNLESLNRCGLNSLGKVRGSVGMAGGGVWGWQGGGVWGWGEGECGDGGKGESESSESELDSTDDHSLMSPPPNSS